MLAWCRWQEPLQSCSLAVLLKLSGPSHFSDFPLFSLHCASVSLLWGIRAKAAVQQNMPAASRIRERRSGKKLWRILQSRSHHGDWETRPHVVKTSQLHGGSEDILLGYLQILQSLHVFLPSNNFITKVLKSELYTSFMTHINISGEKTWAESFYWDFSDSLCWRPYLLKSYNMKQTSNLKTNFSNSYFIKGYSIQSWKKIGPQICNLFPTKLLVSILLLFWSASPKQMLVQWDKWKETSTLR